jgi:hypothetical protein
MLGVAVAIGAGALHGAFGTPDRALAQATPAGEPARVSPPAWFLTLHQLHDPYPGDIQAPAEPPAGTRYVAAELQIDNESDQALDFTPADIRLQDEAGFEYRGGTAIGAEPMLNARNLNGGERSRGWVWFTVTAEARLAGLIYAAPGPLFRVPLA